MDLSVMVNMKKLRNLIRIFLSLVVFFFALMVFNPALINISLTYDMLHVFR